MADISKWLYRGEGNACLVLANREEKMVYRLAKSTHWGKGKLATKSLMKADRIHEELQLVVDYMRDVMQPLLSASYVSVPELSMIAGGLTEEAERQIKASRPAQRKGKEVDHSTVDPTTLSALVMPDLCYVRETSACNKSSTTPTLSVEIKPKKAFMHCQSTSTSRSEEKQQVCKFCMHQRLKAKEGQWPVTSRYCPLDLFSGNKSRMKQALLGLAETPQNNLRICQDGEEIHGAWNQEDLNEILENFLGPVPLGRKNGHLQYKSVQIFLDLVLEALLFVPEDCAFVSHKTEPTTSTRNVQYCQNIRYPSTDVCSHTADSCDLPTGCVLERILSIQRLDSLDIEEVFPLYEHLQKYLDEHPSDRSELCLDGPFCPSKWLEPCIESTRDEDNLYIEHNIQATADKVKQFLVSKTVQDCSVMVALQRVSDSCNEDLLQSHLQDVYGRKFRFSVSIIDLDPKPFSKIPTYLKQDRQILHAYREQDRQILHAYREQACS